MSDEATSSMIPPRLTRAMRGVGVRQVRLFSGVILFVYLISHFANHALGNISTDAMNAVLQYEIVFWRSWPATIVLSAAALAHTALGIWALYERRQFRWTSVEVTQLVLGLSIPVLLFSHLVGVRVAASLFGHEKYYEQVLSVLGRPPLYVDGSICRPADIVDSRLYRPLFLAAHEAVVQARCNRSCSRRRCCCRRCRCSDSTKALARSLMPATMPTGASRTWRSATSAHHTTRW